MQSLCTRGIALFIVFAATGCSTAPADAPSGLAWSGGVSAASPIAAAGVSGTREVGGASSMPQGSGERASGTGGMAAGGMAAGGGGIGGAGGTSAGSRSSEVAGAASAPHVIELSAELYDDDAVPRFDIEIPQASVDALAAEPEAYVRGTFRYGSETLTDVGVRIKGEASLRSLEQKAALKLKFDKFVPDQSFRGLRRMTLNNMVEDPSFLAERLAYFVYRAAKLPAPRCNSAVVYVNYEAFGLYANVETEDKTFLRRWFANDDGNLYEEGQRDFEPGAESAFDLETNETANDRSDMRNLIATIQSATVGSLLPDWDRALDTKHFLRFTAAEAAVNQWDMYSYTVFYPNNFRVYHDPTSNKFVFLPWGMDMSMKPFRDSGKPFISVYALARRGGALGAPVTAGLLFQRCVAEPECKAKYTAAVRDILAVYEASGLAALATRWYEQIKPHVQADPRKEYTDREFETAYHSVLSTIRGRAAAMRSDIGD